METQYCHKRKTIINEGCMRMDDAAYFGHLSSTGGETIAVESLEPWFMESLKEGEFFEKRVGKARCSDEDNYCKAIGREYARSRMKLTKLTVLSNTDFDGVRILVLQDNDKNSYVFEKRTEYKRVHFVGYNE